VSAAPVYRHVVVGTDGSPTARRAVEQAVTVARLLDAPLTVATSWYRNMPDRPVPSEVVQFPGGTVEGHEARWAATTVADAAAVGRRAGVDPVITSTPQGAPADALIGLVDGDALLVVGTWGLGSRAERLIGNVPHQITHHAPSDVLLVSTAAGDSDTAYHRVAIGTDGSATASVAVTRGVAFARGLGAEATLLTAARDRADGQAALDRAARRLDGVDTIDRRVVVGRRAGPTLMDAAGAFDLLVIGNKGMSGPSRLLGSVANEVTHRLPTDLLLVNTVGRS
jgi:nucleotide-binding universal stress UspA family protein